MKPKLFKLIDKKPVKFKLTITVTEPMVIMPYRWYLERVFHTPSGGQHHGYRPRKVRRG